MSLLVLWGVIAAELAAYRSIHPEAPLVYALDDAYIHMAMAKNVCQHGVFGVTRHGFTSCSSSPLWTLLLAACYGTFGVNDLGPLLLGAVTASAVLVLVFGILRMHLASRVAQAAAMLLFVVSAPLPPLVLTGLEHCLCLGLVIAMAYALSVQLGDAPGRRGLVAILCLAPLVAVARYEGLFLLAAGAILLLLRDRWRTGLAVLVLGTLPVLIFGLLSVAKGWSLLPNSVLLKADRPDLTSTLAMAFYATRAIRYLNDTPQVLLLFLIAVGCYVVNFTKDRPWTTPQNLLIVFLGTTLLHMQFAKTGWFYRYEAYLIALGIVAIGISLPELWRRMPPARRGVAESLPASACALAAVVAVGGLMERGIRAMGETPRAMANIYEQQYQMGLFLCTHYQGEAVAAIDIGAISYLADIRLVDLLGLASNPIAQQRLRRTYDTDAMAQACQRDGVRLAILHENVFQKASNGLPALPTGWRKVGQWTIRNNVVCGGDTVSFYAVREGESTTLLGNLREFSSRLPRSIQVAYKVE